MSTPSLFLWKLYNRQYKKNYFRKNTKKKDISFDAGSDHWHLQLECVEHLEADFSNVVFILVTNVLQNAADGIKHFLRILEIWAATVQHACAIKHVRRSEYSSDPQHFQLSCAAVLLRISEKELQAGILHFCKCNILYPQAEPWKNIVSKGQLSHFYHAMLHFPLCPLNFITLYYKLSHKITQWRTPACLNRDGLQSSLCSDSRLQMSLLQMKREKCYIL